MVNGESIATQHWLVMLIMRVTILKKSKTKRVRKIQWWKLKNVGLRAEFKQKVLENWKQTEGVQEWWSVNSKILLKAAEEVLGKTSGKKAPADKETWWWNEEVQQVVKWKKALKKKWDTSGSEEDREEYKEAKQEAW